MKSAAGHEMPPITKAPEVGQHNAEVLREVLGYDDAQIEVLQESGVLG